MRKRMFEYVSFTIAFNISIIFITYLIFSIYMNNDVLKKLQILFGILFVAIWCYFFYQYFEDKKQIPRFKYIQTKFVRTTIHMIPFAKYGYIIKANFVYFEESTGKTIMFSNSSFLLYTYYEQIKRIKDHQEDPWIWVGYVPDEPQKYIVFLQSSLI